MELTKDQVLELQEYIAFVKDLDQNDPNVSVLSDNAEVNLDLPECVRNSLAGVFMWRIVDLLDEVLKDGE